VERKTNLTIYFINSLTWNILHVSFSASTGWLLTPIDITTMIDLVRKPSNSTYKFKARNKWILPSQITSLNAIHHSLPINTIEPITTSTTLCYKLDLISETHIVLRHIIHFISERGSSNFNSLMRTHAYTHICMIMWIIRGLEWNVFQKWSNSPNLINGKCIGHGIITEETIIDGMHPKGPRWATQLFH